LMYALPKQSLDQWFVSLEQGITMQAEHLSCYQLTVEPHTALHVTHQKQKLALPDEDLATQFFWQTRHRLAEAGYGAYEISNFARKDEYCRHNMGYWLYDDFIGIGAGAAGKWDGQDGCVLRYSNIRAPQRYMDVALNEGVAMNSQENLGRQQAMGEAIWLGLRRSDGVNQTWFKQRFGQSIQDVYPILIQQWLNQGKISMENQHIRLTDAGLILADDIAASFLL